jgi:hypothetical protein
MPCLKHGKVAPPKAGGTARSREVTVSSDIVSVGDSVR